MGVLGAEKKSSNSSSPGVLALTGAFFSSAGSEAWVAGVKNSESSGWEEEGELLVPEVFAGPEEGEEKKESIAEAGAFAGPEKKSSMAGGADFGGE
jgi:hypothetical protein